MENRDVNKIYVSACLLLLLLLLWVPGVRAAAPWAAENIVISCDRWPAATSLEGFADDCIRLAGARTDEEKAVAVWKYIQYLTAAGSPPKELAYGNNYILNPLKLLNVYGVHWCDGLSRIMTMTWRSLGYRAEKLYKFGHTLADCWWRDEDGVERWHVFDVSQYWYVYNRGGTHIATPDELVVDHSLISFPSRTPVPSWPSLLQPSYVHAGHLKFKLHKTGINLRDGESINFLWGNEGKPYTDLFKKARRGFAVTPYPLTYGNGRLVYSPVFSTIKKEPESVKMVGLAVVENGGEAGFLQPEKVGVTGSLIIPVCLPYIISDAWLSIAGQVGSGDRIRCSISVDDGQTWHSFWENDAASGEFAKQKINLCSPLKTPFGRYDYLLKIELSAAEREKSCFLQRLILTTVFQHNFLALPMLWPGKNLIAVEGELQDGAQLQVSYTWAAGKRGKREDNYRSLAHLPATYEIKTRGKIWSDCRCTSLSIKAFSGQVDGTGDEQYGETMFPVKPEKIVKKMRRSQELIGRGKVPSLKNAAHYIELLEKSLQSTAAKRENRSFLKKQAKVIRQAVSALGAMGDPAAAPILVRVIKEDISHPCYNKVKACQALYRSVGKPVIPVMIQVLQRDSSIVWYDRDHRWPDDTMWLHTAAMAAAILADIKDFPERAVAARLVAATLQGVQTQYKPEKLWRGREILWGFIKNLGKLGSKKDTYLLQKYLAKGGDAGAQAALALSELGDPAAISAILVRLQDFEYPPVGLYSIAALGEIGSAAQGKFLYPFLTHWDEDFRGAAAAALGRMGDDSALPRLQELVRKESFPWVREASQRSIDMLTGQ